MANSSPTSLFRINWRRLTESRPAILIGLAVLVAICFGGSVTNGFVQDDHILINNPSIRSLSHGLRLFRENYWGDVPRAGVQYRPLTNLSLALNFAVGGENPVGYHLVNLALTLVGAALLFQIVGEYGGTRRIAWSATALFVAHPVHTEVVIPVFGRGELLVFAFCAGSMLAYRRSIRTGKGYGWSLSLFFLGLLSKENAVVLPGILILADWCADRWPAWRRHFLNYAGFAAVFVGYLVFRLAAFGALSPSRSDTVFQDAPFPARFWTMCRGFTTYFRLLAWPRTLCADYDFSLLPLTPGPTVPAVAGLVLVLAVGLAGIFLIHRRSWIGCGILVFFVGVSVVSNLPFPTGILIAERVLYLPSVGVCVIGGMLFEWIWNRGWRFVGGAALASVLVLAAVQDNLRNRDWRDDRAWIEALVRVAPNNPKGLMALAAVQERDGRMSDAEATLRRAVEVAPNLSVTYGNLGSFYLRRGRVAEARVLLEKSVALSKRFGQFYLDLGRLYFSNGETARGLAVFQEGMDLVPRTAELLNECGTLFMADGQYSNAEGRFRAALALRAQDPRVLQNLALALQRQDKLVEALAFWDKLAAIEPNNPAVHTGRGTVLLRRGEYPAAIAEFERARDLDPTSLETMNNLGIALAQSGRTAEALSVFERVLAIAPHYLPARRNFERLAELNMVKQPK